MKINKHTLDNGLRIVHHEDKSTKMAALNILYQVGSRNETPQCTGFAHLMEHLMFGGSANIPNFDKPLQTAGGENNAYTTLDYTNYYMTLPADNLEIGMWLESDRMLSLAFTPESLEVQRKVVMEEFMMNYINQPYGDLSHIMAAMAYKTHPYRWPTIGLKLEHIEKANMDMVKNFFFKHYCPENAILSVVGNVPFDKVTQLAQKWFGDIPRRDYKPDTIQPEAPQQRQRRKTVRRDVPSDLLSVAFHIGHRLSPDFNACDMITDILSNGRSCRLHKHLVEQKKLFTNIDAYVSGNKDGGMLYITGMPTEDTPLEKAEAAIWDEISALKKDGATGEEMEKAKNKYEMNAAMERSNYQRVATLLAYNEMVDKAELIDKDVEQYQATDNKAILAASRKYLTKKNSCVLYYKKKENDKTA